MSPKNNKFFKEQELNFHSHNNKVLPCVVISTKASEREAASISPRVLLGHEVAVSHTIAPNYRFLFSNAITRTIKKPQIQFVVGKNDIRIKQVRFKRFLKKIKQCRKGTIISLKHKCGAPLFDEKGKRVQLHITCDNKYCDNPYCIESRKIKAKERLAAYKIKPKKLMHLIISFPIQFGETDEKKQKRELILRYIKEELKKQGIKFLGLGVFDIKGKGHGNLKQYFIHFHFALYPQCHAWFVRALILTRKIIMKKMSLSSGEGFTLTSKNYKPKKALFNYFAKIMAGLVSDEEDHHETTYNKIMSPIEYFDFFYRKRVLRIVGLKKFKKNGGVSAFEPERSEYMFQRLGFIIPKICPGCGKIITPDSIKHVKIIGKEKPPDLKGVFPGLNWHLSY